MFLGKYFPPSMATKLGNEITNFRHRPDESLFEAWERYKLSIDRCPNHNMLPVTQIDTFYNGLTLRHRDTINAAACGTFMKRRPEECYDLIENMIAHHNEWDTSVQQTLKAEMAKINKNLMRLLQVNQQVKADTPNCETCGGPHSFTDCPATVGQTQNNGNSKKSLGSYSKGGTIILPPVSFEEHVAAKIEKKEWEVKFVESLAREVKSLYERFVKAGRMHEVSPPIIGTFMPTSYKSDLEETQETFGSNSNTSSINTSDSNDFVPYDNSDKSSASKTYDFASCVSSPKTNDSFSTVDVKIFPKSDVKDPSPSNGFPSYSFKENVKPPKILCDKTSVPAGSRNSSASTSAGRSIPAASRNRPASIHAGRHISAGRSCPTGWDNHAARPFFRPTNLYFDNVSWPGIYKHMSMNEGSWGSAHFNLFSVSQICDKKNKVLFTDGECLVLTKEFQLPDESQVVLRIPRRHDLYMFNLSDIQPEQQINCLLAKASLEESTKWHRRMAHVNFKTINKLAKHGVVEGLPLKLFTNEHNCVACNKEKQHKASYKAISAMRTISEPLKLLHMDLFGPTSIKSIDHKYYSLVVTDCGV
nr:ribonuclease H-like domain-containing protein [Tanacetum cinerariifolium]